MAESDPVPKVATAADAESVVKPRPANEAAPSGGCGSSVVFVTVEDAPDSCLSFVPTTRA